MGSSGGLAVESQLETTGDDELRDISSFLQQFRSRLSISPRKEPLRKGSLRNIEDDEEVARQRCVEFLKKTFDRHTRIVLDEQASLMAYQCFEILVKIMRNEIDENILKLQMEFVIRLIDTKNVILLKNTILQIFRQLYNVTNKDHLANDLDLLEKRLSEGIPFNVFNVKYSRYVTSLYILVTKLVLSSETEVFSKDSLSKMINARLWNWLKSVEENRESKLEIYKKSLINYSNRCKSVWKLTFILKSLLFSGEILDQIILKHLLLVLEKLCKADELLTYQYTSKPLYETLILRNDLNFEKVIKVYNEIKLRHKELSDDDLSWKRFLRSEDNQNTDLNIELRLSALHDKWDHDSVLKLIKLTIGSIKLEDLERPKLISLSLSVLKTDTHDIKSDYLVSFLDFIANYVKNLEFDASSNDLIKDLSVIYRKLNRIDKYRNLSNICFQNGGNLVLTNLKESLNQWMNSVNYEYNYFAENLNLESFNFFKQKVERISNLLIESKRYHESNIFLFKNFECFNKLPTISKNFLQLEKLFNDELKISLKLLFKSTVLSKSVNLTNLDEKIHAFIISGLLDFVGRFNIDGKTLIINDIMDNLKTSIKDRGIFQYLLIKYYNCTAIDAFIHINYKNFNIKEFPEDSLVLNYKELIVCYNYLQYTINRVFNQTIIIRCIELFQRWLQLKPNSLLSNNALLFNLEFKFLKTLVSYLRYQKLQIHRYELLQSYIKTRDPLFSVQQRSWLKFAIVESLKDCNCAKEAHKELQFITPLTIMDKLKHSICEFQIELLQESTRSSQTFKNLLQIISNEKEFTTFNGVNSLRLIENLTILLRISCLSALYKHRNGSHVDAISDVKRAIRLGKTMLNKYLSNLSNIDMMEFNTLKWQISSLMVDSLNLAIEIMLHCGLTKNSQYYIDELSQFLEPQQFPLVKCSSLYKIAEYYLLAKKYMIANENMIKSDEIYNSLEFEDSYLELKGLAAHAFYFQMIGDHKNEIAYYQKIDAFYEDVKQGRMNKVFSKLMTDDPGYLESICIQINFKRFFKYPNDQWFKQAVTSKRPQNMFFDVIKLKERLHNARSLLNSDPVLSGLEESVVSIPSTLSSNKNNTVIGRLLHNLNASGEEILASLDENWSYWKLHELHDLNKTTNSISFLKSAISSKEYESTMYFTKDEIARSLPFLYDRLLLSEHEDLQKLIPELDFKSVQMESHTLDRLKLNLPLNWIVNTLDVCPFSGDLLIGRYTKDLDKPLIVRLPLNRHHTRDIDEKYMSFDDAMRELKRIIEESNMSTKMERVSNIRTKEDKAKWWEERRNLDHDLQELLKKVEVSWIAGFKGIFEQTRTNDHLKLEFKQKFDIILNQYLPSRFNKKAKGNNRVEVDDQILEIFFLSLSLPLNSTELLEDLIYFLLETLLYHGEENSFDEIDIDHMYIDIEELLVKYHEQNILREFNSFEHTVLIVGKDCCNFPWESLSFLRKNSVTRFPSMGMLCDLLESHQDLSISKAKGGSFIINPNNDLSRTEMNFKDRFTNSPTWTGLVGTRPSEDQFKEMLSESDLFVYIGHGSGDQYIRSSTIKSITKCSASLLIGCSSGLLHENGMLEPYGTVYNHLIAGSPMVVVNLWDVTDKDIDKFTLSVLEKWGLFSEARGRNISKLVSLSRDECHLKFLNGAAPIIYGLPLRLGA